MILGKTFRIETLGCKVNQYNSQWMRENLLFSGWKENKGGWMILNGCVVTQTAERKSRKKIYQAQRRGEKVIITGCFARYVKEFPGSISIPEYEKVIEFLTNSAPSLNRISEFPKHQRVWVKVQEGCPDKCSYCIVPRVRGKVYSRPQEEILDEVEKLDKKFGEIVITGTHLGIYGKRRGESLGKLLREILKKVKKARIRLSSIEIGEINEPLIELFSSSSLCPHLHVPLQSGSSKILKLMRRSYTGDEYLRKVEEIRRKKEGIAFTTDIMVGFPFEEENDFKDTLKMIKEVGFHRVHIFPFSSRRNTPADSFPHLPEKVIKERTKLTSEFAKEVSYKVRKKEIGREKEIIMESEKGGYSEDYLWIEIPRNKAKLGEKISVKITDVTRNYTKGEVKNGKEKMPGCQSL